MKAIVIVIVCAFMISASIQIKAQSKAGTKPASVTEFTSAQGEYIPPAGSGNTGAPIKYPGVENEVYVGSDWPAGIIVLRNGSTIDNYYLRYNILEDQMQFISGKDTLAFASPKELNTITFGGHTFIYEAFQCENTIRKGYFELIEPGKNKLLLKRVVTAELDPVSVTPGVDSRKYFIDECYFISKPGQPASKLACNRKSALAVLHDHSAEIEEYLRITGNKVKTPEDLKKLVIYYNSLDE